MCNWGEMIVMYPPDRRLTPNRRQNDWVAVDQCLEDAVRALWDCGYATLSACCGHGRGHGEITVFGCYAPAEHAQETDA